MLQTKWPTVPAKLLRTVAVALILVGSALAAPKYKVLHAFGAGKDGGGLWGSLVFDMKGNLYGTTSGGGLYGYGTVFQLTPRSDGKWAETLLHSFKNDDSDGDDLNSGLTFDAAGNLYGTTSAGGGPDTYGTVFEMKLSSRGWVLNVIHRFSLHDRAGGSPYAGVLMDKAGGLYGVAYGAFELLPGPNGWREAVLHQFTGRNGDGEDAFAGLIMDAVGNLYGTTEHGGTSKLCGGGCGTVYELQRTSSGWKEHILHDFGTGDDDMALPGVGALVLDSAGNLYGTAGGGASRAGVAFRVTRSPDGHWKTTIQYAFTGGANGDQPGAGVVMDNTGNLYGTTIAGGDPKCQCGVVYKLAPQANGKWKYTVLHTFVGSDGAQPDANLILDSKGNLYGTTATGGAGVAFELTP
jgi:uncharacterized repeat protein (TIGR03803 family)